MKFEQVRISKTLETFFGENFRKKWDLRIYNDPRKPSVFFGLYSEEDLQAFQNHKSTSLVIWGGSDMKNNQLNIVKKLVDRGNSFTFAPPGEFNLVLKSNNILHKVLYIPNKDYSRFRPTVLGDKIYVYKGAKANKFYPSYFKWEEIIQPVIDHFGSNRVIFTNNKTIDFLINQVYSKSFVYIKPNEKGGTTTMYELAHMGRRTIGKGEKNSVHFSGYSNLQDLISLIKNEEQYIGSIRKNIAESMKTHFIGNEWLNLDFWK